MVDVVTVCKGHYKRINLTRGFASVHFMLINVVMYVSLLSD